MTADELELIAEKEREAQQKFIRRLNVCAAAGCLSCQSGAVKDALAKEIARRELNGRCQVKGVGCMGLCSEGPLVSTGGGRMYKRVSAADAAALLEDLPGSGIQRLHCAADIPFFQRQKKIVLENSGLIDRERIEEYIAQGGY